eukprot:PhF_6_TR11265/c0_g1_i1/m.18172
MSTPVEFYRVPSLIPSYLKVAALTPFRKGSSAPWPTKNLQYLIHSVTTKPATIACYCNLTESRSGMSMYTPPNYIPPLYPHVMLSGAHIGIMADTAFPYNLMGAVHYRNRILQHKPMPTRATYAAQVELSPKPRILEKGVEWTLYTSMWDSRDITKTPIWEELSVFYVKQKKSDTKPLEFDSPVKNINTLVPLEPHVVRHATNVVRWKLETGIGVPYAMVSGDINPIHMNPLLARLFGLPRTVAHGMCALGNITHLLTPATRGDTIYPLDLTCAFKGPLFLGNMSKSFVIIDTTKNVQRFDTYIDGNDLPVLLGKLEFQSKTKTLHGA